MKTAFLVLLLTFSANIASAQTNRIDIIRPDAPELAAFGAHDIGVRTLVVTDSGRPDVLNARDGEPVPIHERSLMAGFAADANHFLNGVVDANSTAIIGYSMGGYGAVNNLGAGYSEASVASGSAPPNRLLNDLAAGNPDYRRSLDPRIKAGIPIGAWGMRGGFWDAEGLAGLTVPALFVAGDADGVAGYEDGVRAIYEGAINSDRYMLVFKNAGHNAGAPIPLPVEFLDAANAQGASHYTDSVWDTVRMNNILQHFATAFLDLHLKGVGDMRSYLDLPQDGAAAGQAGWKGFAGRGAVGLLMYHD